MIDCELAQLGASRLSATGLAVVTATNPIGSPGGDVESFGEVDHINSLGITSRPFPANDAGHAEAPVLRGVPGCLGLALGGRDERCGDMYAALAEGDTVVHATGPSHAAQLKCAENGTVTALTTDDGTVTGRSVFWQIRPDAFRGIAPWGKLTYDQSGFHVRHYTGARIDLGGIGGLPAPLDAMGAYITLAAPIVKIEGSAIALGTAEGVPEPVAKATTTLAVLAEIGTALTAVTVALNALNASLVTPGAASPGVAPAIAAVAAAVAAISGAAATLPSLSTTVT